MNTGTTLQHSERNITKIRIQPGRSTNDLQFGTIFFHQMARIRERREHPQYIKELHLDQQYH